MCECSVTPSDEGSPEETDTPAEYRRMNPGTEKKYHLGDGAAIGRGMTDGCSAHAPV